MPARHAVLLTLPSDSNRPPWSYRYTGTLPRLISFVSHSCTNTGGVGVFFPFWDSTSAVQSRTPCWIQVLSFQTLAHSFVPFCTHQKFNPFLSNRFRTLCQKKASAGVGIFQLTTFNFQLSIVGSSRTIPASRPGRRHDL